MLPWNLISGNNLVRLVQQELTKTNLWQDDFNDVIEKLKLVSLNQISTTVLMLTLMMNDQCILPWFNSWAQSFIKNSAYLYFHNDLFFRALVIVRNGWKHVPNWPLCSGQTILFTRGQARPLSWNTWMASPNVWKRQVENLYISSKS